MGLAYSKKALLHTQDPGQKNAGTKPAYYKRTLQLLVLLIYFSKNHPSFIAPKLAAKHIQNSFASVEESFPRRC